MRQMVARQGGQEGGRGRGSRMQAYDMWYWYEYVGMRYGTSLPHASLGRLHLRYILVHSKICLRYRTRSSEIYPCFYDK